MRTFKKKYIIIFLFLMIMPIILWFGIITFNRIHGKWYYNTLKNNDRVYAYDTFSTALNNAYYIEDLKYKNELATYYSGRETKKFTGISFPFKAFNYSRPLLVVKYSSPDSSFVELVDFDTTCWGYLKGYVDKRTVTHHLASQKLIDRRRKFFTEYQESYEYRIAQLGRHPQNRISDYGLQCKCCEPQDSAAPNH